MAQIMIVNGQNNTPQAQQNPGALGNAWFVDTIKTVANLCALMKLPEAIGLPVRRGTLRFFGV